MSQETIDLLLYLLSKVQMNPLNPDDEKTWDKVITARNELMELSSQNKAQGDTE